MTVSTTTTKNSAAGNGSTTAFTYSFVITAASELKVYIRTDSSGAEALKTDGTHYNVAGVGAASGGTVTFTSGNIPASGETVVLLRDTPLTQATDYVENDPFPAAAHEDALDKLTHQVQELQEEVDRSLKASKTVTDLTTPEFKDPAATRAGKFLAFDGDGDELTVTDGPLADAVVSSPADAHVLLYDGTDTRWENKAVSGDISITSAGVTSIASGVIVNADVNASAAIADSKLATISTADKVSGAAVQVDGATDGTSITVADATKLLVDDGGTTKYVNASQINSYVSASVAADDIGTGDAAASFQTSSGSVTIDSQASTTTVDGHTGVTVQSSNSGDILLDRAADVVLDSAGNDITLKAAGTTFGALTNSSSDLVIESKVADKDILFKGTDDSSAVTALSLDMSEGGKATFAGDVVVTGDLTISGDDLVMGTNTSGAALIGDGTNYNPVVISGDISIGTDGTAAIGSGVIVNADINGSAAIADSKLDTISTANKVGLAALDIDGGTELGEAIVDADLFIIDNGAGGTNRKVLASRLKTYASGSGVSLANDANNRVTTADGSGGINGEAKLLFDPPKLTIGSGAAEDPVVVWDGNAQDWHAGIDDTDDDFKIGLGSTVGTTAHIVIDATGAVTKPLQPALLAVADNVNNVTGNGDAYTPAAFATEVFDRNADFSSNTFTCPVTGIYAVGITAQLGGMTSSETRARAICAASNRSIDLFDVHGYNVSQPDPKMTLTGYTLVDADASDTIVITIYVFNGSKVVDWKVNSTLSIHLVA